MSRGSGVPWAFSSRDSLLVDIIRSPATSLRDLPPSSRSFLSASPMPRRGPSGPVTLATAGRPRERAAPAGPRLAWDSHPATVQLTRSNCTATCGRPSPQTRKIHVHAVQSVKGAGRTRHLALFLQCSRKVTVLGKPVMGIPLGDLQTEFEAGASWARGRYHPSRRRTAATGRPPRVTPTVRAPAGPLRAAPPAPAARSRRRPRRPGPDHGGRRSCPGGPDPAAGSGPMVASTGPGHATRRPTLLA